MSLIFEKTYDGLKDGPSRTSELKVPPNEYRVWLARDVRKDVGAKITGRACHVRESHEECTPLSSQDRSRRRDCGTHGKAENKGADEGAHEALHSLLRTQLDQRGSAKQLSYSY